MREGITSFETSKCILHCDLASNKEQLDVGKKEYNFDYLKGGM